jgi:hypothetical protein
MPSAFEPVARPYLMRPFVAGATKGCGSRFMVPIRARKRTGATLMGVTPGAGRGCACARSSPSVFFVASDLSVRCRLSSHREPVFTTRARCGVHPHAVQAARVRPSRSGRPPELVDRFSLQTVQARMDAPEKILAGRSPGAVVHPGFVCLQPESGICVEQELTEVKRTNELCCFGEARPTHPKGEPTNRFLSTHVHVSVASCSKRIAVFRLNWW